MTPPASPPPPPSGCGFPIPPDESVSALTLRPTLSELDDWSRPRPAPLKILRQIASNNSATPGIVMNILFLAGENCQVFAKFFQCSLSVTTKWFVEAVQRKVKIQSLIFIPHWVCTYFLIRNQTGPCRSLGAAAWIQQAIYAIDSKNLKIRPAHEHQAYRWIDDILEKLIYNPLQVCIAWVDRTWLTEGTIARDASATRNSINIEDSERQSFTCVKVGSTPCLFQKMI